MRTRNENHVNGWQLTTWLIIAYMILLSYWLLLLTHCNQLVVQFVCVHLMVKLKAENHIKIKLITGSRSAWYHLDVEFSHYVLTGLAQGFCIGFDRAKVQCVGPQNNMQSALQHPSVVEDYLQNEIALGRVIGPVSMSRVPSIQINRFGVIPKNHQPGKWRLIVDLSDPAGFSINDGID